MQPRTLDQVIASLNSIYDPQIQSVQQRMNAIPGQVQTEEQGLQAKQGQAYDDITRQANARGVAFGGIPMGEQAKYSSTEYLPALARLRESAHTQQMSLQDALSQINERRANQGQSIYQYEQDFAESKRRFDEQAAAAAADRAAAARAASDGWSPTYGNDGTVSSAPAAAADKYAALGDQKQAATNALVGLFNTKNVSNINATINAIRASASRGNLYDQYKLELIGMYQKNSPYANLISQALSYRAPAPAAKPAPKTIPSQSGTGVLNLITKR